MSQGLVELIDKDKSIIKMFRLGQRLWGHYKANKGLSTVVWKWLRDDGKVPDTVESLEAFLLGWQDADKNGNVDLYTMSNAVLQTLNEEVDMVLRVFNKDYDQDAEDLREWIF